MPLPSSQPLRLAIVGAGTIGTIHALAAQQTQQVVVTAVWSRTFDKARALAERVGARAYQDLSEAMHSSADAVAVCTPTFLHAEHALTALRAGKHVFCEKPLAGCLAEARGIITAAQQEGKCLYVGHVARFFADFARLHDLVVQGAVGTPAVVRMSRAASFPHGSGEWHSRRELSGGVVLDMGIHDLDWLLWTLGPAERVYAQAVRRDDRTFLDYALLVLRMRSGAIVHVESSWAEAAGFRVHGEVAGDKGLIAYDSLDSTALSIELRQPPDTPPGVVVPTTYTTESPYAAQLAHFARYVRGEEPPCVTPEDAFEALRLASAANESIGTGRPVTL